MLTIERLKEILFYEQENGKFIRKISIRSFKAGEVAGSEVNGYEKICIDGRQYPSHRLAWFYIYGEWPKCQIDHINGKKKDNRIKNLREATNSENKQNMKKARKDSSTGILGVSWRPKSKKWFSTIRINGKAINLGYHKTKEEASSAYLRAKSTLHPFAIIHIGMIDHG